jgi:hypothetical protein
MAKSVASERKVSFYPKPTYLKALENHCQKTGESKSGVASKALKEFFDKKNNNLK